MENWKFIKEYEGLYAISDLGRVKSSARFVNNNGGLRQVPEKILVSRINKRRNNYRYVTLCVKGKKQNRYVHELVLTSFIGPRPATLQGCHNNGDVSDNCLSNLRWDTSQSNNKDKVLHGTQPMGEKCTSSKLTNTQVLEIRNRAQNEFHHVIASDYGISRQQVDRIVNKVRWKHI